ncbi:MAG: hypothetical protein AB7V43_16790, partial [Acidimicrobiia bacterium]
QRLVRCPRRSQGVIATRTRIPTVAASLVLAALVLPATLLTACGDKDSSTVVSNPTPTVAVVTSTATTTPGTTPGTTAATTPATAAASTTVAVVTTTPKVTTSTKPATPETTVSPAEVDGFEKLLSDIESDLDSIDKELNTELPAR